MLIEQLLHYQTNIPQIDIVEYNQQKFNSSIN